MKALGIAATGMLAQQTNVDVIANNIANANTTGFKSGRAAFQDLIYQAQLQEGAATSTNGTSRPVGLNVGLGVQGAGVVRLNTQGALAQTENQFDLAVNGRGFFVVTRPDGSQAYTRAGAFQVSATGQLVTLDGFEVDPGINIPDDARSVVISGQGLVQAFLGNDNETTDLGQLNLATFLNEAGMKPIGNNLLEETTASGAATIVTPGDPGVGLVQQGYLENANVNIVAQITDLIQAQRAYEMNSRSIETADQMLQTANQIKS
ncbi:flagellar basal-body rod protein FlgG [Cognatishimia sp. D5M38]|uniref:Flagellar basal-body rod protein FlgG n=2 Tax=Cognatishimia TaxID=2211635 RepID=A0A975I8L9_9RHOB|nr:flagellar basal-body rod protein FlgG [Cognatishimia activa]QTN37164.1 flagellar basal-body rod protein FlgG [Cognatishimia activa]